jgi:hypothetical protein
MVRTIAGGVLVRHPPHHKLSNWVVGLKMYQFFGKAFDAGTLQKGTLGEVDGCAGGGKVCIVHVDKKAPSPDREAAFLEDGLVIHGAPSTRVSWFFKRVGVVVVSQGSGDIDVRLPGSEGGVDVVTWTHVKGYFEPYANNPDIPWASDVLQDLYTDVLYVYVSLGPPHFLGVANVLFHFDSSQQIFLEGGVVE